MFLLSTEIFMKMNGDKLLKSNFGWEAFMLLKEINEHFCMYKFKICRFSPIFILKDFIY